MAERAEEVGEQRRQAPLHGVLWMVVAAFFFAVSVGLVPHLAKSMNAFEQTFWRQLIGLLVFLPFMWRRGFRGLRTQQLKTNLIRNLAGYIGIALAFYSVTLIPLEDSLALQFTLPFFTIMFAVILLGEHVGAHRWTATIVGFAGAVVILRPGLVEFQFGMLVAIAAAAFLALSDTLVRRLAHTESTALIVFYGYVLQVPLAFVAALFDWVTPTLADWPWLIALGLTSFAAQWALSRAFVLAEASLVSPILFLRLPIVSAIGYVFFAQVPDPWTWVGAVIIFAAALYMARREAVIQRQHRNASPQP